MRERWTSARRTAVSAAEVIAQEVWQAYVVELGRSMPEGLADKLAAVVVPALKSAGYVVVELPELDDACEVALSGRFKNRPIVTGVDGSMGATYQTIYEARTLAAALLAAADAAEANA
jgi:hypothetical protein